MTREEAQLELRKALAHLRYSQTALVVQLSQNDCKEMFEGLTCVQQYIAGPEAPELRRLASEWRTCVEKQGLGEVTLRAENLLLLCDAVLAFTVPTP